MLEVAPVLLAWTAVIFKVVRSGLHPSPANRTLLAAMLLPTLAITVMIPVVYRWIGDTTRLPNVAMLLATTAGLLCLAPCLNLLLHQRPVREEQRQIRRRRMSVIVALIAVQALFWAQAPGSTPDPRYWLHEVDQAWAVAFLMVYQSALVVVGLICFNVSRNLAQAARGPLRIGMLTVAASGLVSVVLVGINVAYYASVLSGGSIRNEGWPLLPSALCYAAVVAFVVGITIPDWAARLGHQIHGHWQLHELEPLWQCMVAAAPEVVLPEAYSRWDVQHRLHRKVVEIRDASLLLRRRKSRGTTMPEAANVASRSVRLADEISALGNTRGSLQLLPGDLATEVDVLIEVGRRYGLIR